MDLTPELEQLVQNRVDSGRYGSASEVIGAALRLLADREEAIDLQRRNVRDRIAQGVESLRLGHGVDGGEFFAGLEREETALGGLPPA